MGHQRENDVRSSLNFPYIHCCKYGDNVKEYWSFDLICIDKFLVIISFLNRHTTKNVANCINYRE